MQPTWVRGGRGRVRRLWAGGLGIAVGRWFGWSGADRPVVDGGRVGLGAEEQLGRAVPQRHHLVRVRAERHGEGAREAKVGDLGDQGIFGHGDQDIGGLQISMDQAMRMCCSDTLEQVSCQRIALMERELLAGWNQKF